MTREISLRNVVKDDLPIFFEQQNDPKALHMAAFSAKDPTNREAFNTHWQKILADDTVVSRTIIWEGQVAGYVLSYEEDGRPEVSYWLGKAFWGQGIATQALAAFLADTNTTRPIYARAAQDNLGSLRVLDNCDFTIIEKSRGFANARGEEIAELVLVRTDV